jgi:hypothetical protein
VEELNDTLDLVPIGDWLENGRKAEWGNGRKAGWYCIIFLCSTIFKDTAMKL